MVLASPFQRVRVFCTNPLGRKTTSHKRNCTLLPIHSVVIFSCLKNKTFNLICFVLLEQCSSYSVAYFISSKCARSNRLIVTRLTFTVWYNSTRIRSIPCQMLVKPSQFPHCILFSLIVAIMQLVLKYIIGPFYK